MVAEGFLRNKYLLFFCLWVQLLNSQINLKSSADSLVLVGKINCFDSLINSNPAQTKFLLSQINSYLTYNSVSKKHKAAIYKCNSVWNYEYDRCDSSLYWAKLAWALKLSAKDKAPIAFCIAAAHRCAASTDSAIHYFQLAEKYAKINNDTLILIKANLLLGHVNSEIGKFDNASKFYIQSNQFAKAYKKAEYLIKTNLALASNMADRGLRNEALTKLLTTLIECRNSKLIRQEAIVCNNLGFLYKEMNQISSAFFYFRNSLEIQYKLGNLFEIARENNNLASLFISEGKYSNAIPLLLMAKQYSDSISEHPMLPNIYENLATCYFNTGNYKEAFLYKDAQKLLLDSLNNVEMLKNTERLQEEFEAEKRTLEISNLKQENEVKELRSVAHLKQRNWFMALAAGLFIMALLVFFFFRQRVLNARRLNQKNTLIHQQQMQEVIRKSELQSIHTMLETQETERKRIAQDLHDRLGSMLSTVKLQFGHFSPKANEDKERYSKVSHLLDDAVEEIRQVSHNLVSGVLSTFGLVPALKDLIQALKESSALAIELQVHGMNERMDSELEINLYRILQELFNNTIRHAKAGRVDIELSRHPNELTLIYSDNGTGFDTQNLKQSGMGLKNLYSRVDKLGGSLHIDSGKGNGSTFVFNFPLS